MLRPFFSFFGSKWSHARHYPEPEYDTIVEPFAGSAGYSLHHPHLDIVLCDADHVVCAVWEYLIAASPREILQLPDVPVGGDVRDLNVSQEAAWLIGFWLARGQRKPRNRPSGWMDAGLRPTSFWGPHIRERIADQLPYIRHWQVLNVDYSDAPEIEATWFVDPPYVHNGHRYRHGSALLDYDHLAQWCQSRPGQVVVCEDVRATWLPFEPLGVEAHALRVDLGRQAPEAVWVA